jgi:hypothetical protein
MIRRLNIEVNYVRLCPYCKKMVKVKTATCGGWKCQWLHHIALMRKRRKTDQVRPSRRVV